MTRTQIQLPDDLYRDVKALAAEKEWSLAEALRRGAELLLQSYPKERDSREEWQMPEPMHLGPFLAPVEDWRELANERDL